MDAVVPKQEKIEIYLYSNILPKLDIRYNLSKMVKAKKSQTNKFRNENGNGYKIILWTDILPAYTRPGRIQNVNDKGVHIKGWIGALEQALMQTRSKIYSIRHVYDNGLVRDFE